MTVFNTISLGKRICLQSLGLGDILDELQSMIRVI